MNHTEKNGSSTRKDVELGSWDAIKAEFDNFPRPKLNLDPERAWSEEGEWSEDMWVFRGQKADSYPLQPSIERESGSMPWAVLEHRILHEEFQPKARMHTEAGRLPPDDDSLSWLALMRHNGVPTRLLDFTLSPYIALYFALRDRTREEISSSHIVVWAVDARALMKVAAVLAREADQMEVEGKLREPRRFPRPKLSQLRRSAYSDTDSYIAKAEETKRIILDALSPSRVRRNHYDHNGFVGFAVPPIENPRLSSQQGGFLFSGAHALTFQQSLFKMMKRYSGEWCRRFRIPKDAQVGLEDTLFQFNIHDLSLFPDLQGLAGFIRQKLRLYWVSNGAVPSRLP